MRDPFEELMDEHRVIEKVLSALEQAAGQQVSMGFYRKAVEFILRFADQRHHGKEERHLFPLLEKKGVPRHGGPVGVMWDEHEIGRTLLRRMQNLAEIGDRDGLRAASTEYAALMRAHIEKEDAVLFPMGRGLLSPSEVSELRTAFDEVNGAAAQLASDARLADELLHCVSVYT